MSIWYNIWVNFLRAAIGIVLILPIRVNCVIFARLICPEDFCFRNLRRSQDMIKFILLKHTTYENCLFQWAISLLHLQQKCSLCLPWLRYDPYIFHFLSEMWVSSVVTFCSPVKYFIFKYLA